MASGIKSLSDYIVEDIPSAESKKFGIVVSEYYQEITSALYSGCVETLVKHGAKEDHITTYTVPGTFELTAGTQIALKTEKFDAVICLGVVIKGETQHDEYINHAVAQGITQLEIQYSTPCIFGVLTPNTMQQALDRSGGKHGNKGVEAAVTAIKMTHI